MTEPSREGLSARDVKELMSDGFAQVRSDLGRLEDTVSRLVENMNTQLRDYVLWRDFEHAHAEQKVNFEAAKVAHDRDIAAVRTEIRDMKVEAKERDTHARTTRVSLIAVAVTSVLMLPGSLYALYQIFHQ